MVSYVQGAYRKILVSGTTGADAVGIPNHGVTQLDGAAGSYVLAAPKLGARKTLFCTASTSNACIVRGSTGTSVKFDNQNATQLTFSSTVDKCVELMGLSSVRWLILSNVGTVTVGTS